MGKIILYGMEASPPVRAVLLALNALGLDYKFQELDPLKGEHMSEKFLKKNPQHTVPVLDDDGQFLWDSHAIVAYLVRKYGKDDTLYPKDFYQRAIVDQRLHFDSSVLFPSLRNISTPLFLQNVTDIPQEKFDLIYDGLNFLETFLKQEFLAGKTMTLADFSAVATVTSLQALVPIDAAKYPNVTGWISRLAKLPYYEKANARGAAVYCQMIKSKLA